jgi:hypothetical protein
MKIERIPPRQVNIRMVRLTKRSKRSLSRLKYLGGSVVSAIEQGNWWIPCDSFLYSRIRDEFERRTRSFFNIPNDRRLEVKSFESDILGFDDGIYPDYT